MYINATIFLQRKKDKFDNYIKLVDEFSAMLTGASEATARTEKALASEADSLRG